VNWPVSSKKYSSLADPSCRAVWGVGLLPLACWDCGFESRRGHRCSSLVFVPCCTGTDIWVGPISRPGESYLVGSVCNWVSSGTTTGISLYNSEWVEEVRLKKNINSQADTSLCAVKTIQLLDTVKYNNSFTLKT